VTHDTGFEPTCLFCRIARHEIPSTKVFEDDEIYAFRDIGPRAPTHILVIPKAHIPRLSATTPDDAPMLARLLLTLANIASSEKVSDYRLVVNNGAGAGQSVDHLHFHLLAGRSFGWPPG
jgi:histidine triad (HIT) family protein